MALMRQGSVICQTSMHGTGARIGIADRPDRGSVLGVPMERVRVILGDTDNTPHGGGTWASRGAGIGGEAALQAAKAFAQEYSGCGGGHPAIDRGRARYRRQQHRQRRRWCAAYRTE